MPLGMKILRVTACSRDFDETKYMSFLMKYNELLGKYNEIWNIFSNTIKKGFDNEPVYNEKYVYTKAKFCEGKINTNFHCDKVLKEGF